MARPQFSLLRLMLCVTSFSVAFAALGFLLKDVPDQQVGGTLFRVLVLTVCGSSVIAVAFLFDARRFIVWMGASLVVCVAIVLQSFCLFMVALFSGLVLAVLVRGTAEGAKVRKALEQPADDK